MALMEVGASGWSKVSGEEGALGRASAEEQSRAHVTPSNEGKRPAKRARKSAGTTDAANTAGQGTETSRSVSQAQMSPHNGPVAESLPGSPASLGAASMAGGPSQPRYSPVMPSLNGRRSVPEMGMNNAQRRVSPGLVNGTSGGSAAHHHETMQGAPQLGRSGSISHVPHHHHREYRSLS